MAEHDFVLDEHDEQLLRRASNALAWGDGSGPRAGEVVLQRARTIARRRRRIRVAQTAGLVMAMAAAIAVPVILLGHRSAPAIPTHRPRIPAPTTTVPGPTTTVPPSTPTTTTTVAPASSWSVPPSEVDWSTVAFPVNDGCGPGQKFPWAVVQETAMTPSNGSELAIVLVACRSGAGTPPSNLLVYDGATSAASPHYLTTLMAWPTQDYQASSFSVSGTVVSIVVAGYSTTSVPRCCPNVHKTLQWTWANGSFRSG